MAGTAEYRTEHVAETPRGWRVRMKAPGPRSEHLVAIAFPPGRRKKGSGRLVEILHPANEHNQKCEISQKARTNPGELIIFGNPSQYRARKLGREGAGMRTAAKLYRRMSELLAAGKVEESNKVRMRLARLNNEMGWVMADAARFAEGPLGRNPSNGLDSYAKKHLSAWIKSQGYRGREGSEVRRKILSVVREYPEVLQSPGARSWPEILRMAGNPRRLTVPEKHQLRIAKQTLLMSPEMVRVMGGMTVDEAKKVVRHLTGKNPRGRTVPEILRECDKIRAALRMRMNPLTEKQKEATARAAKVLETKGYQSFLDFLGRNLAKHEQKTKSRRRMNAKEYVGEHNGIAMYFEGISYNAPALKLYGYSTDLALKRAIDRKLKTRRNPEETEQAVRLFEKFHGRDPKDITEKHVSAAMRKDYTALGDLEHLKVITPLGQTVQFQFEGDGVKLASSPDGKQLYCIGGNQNLARCLDAESLEKDFIDLGEAVQVQYLARKAHANFEPVSYYHNFGERTGAKPQLAYDKLKKQIFFVGGEYFIDTTQAVSPGIEN